MKVERAHVITLELGADSLEVLCQDLKKIAFDLIRGKITRGCYGSPSSGAVYEYRHNPEMTHEKYFEAISAIDGRSRPATEGERK